MKRVFINPYNDYITLHITSIHIVHFWIESTCGIENGDRYLDFARTEKRHIFLSANHFMMEVAAMLHST